MRILLVSMNSIHFRRWTSQLENSGHEVYWFDIKDQGFIPSLWWVHQITDWKKGFLKKRGRTWLKRQVPRLYNFLERKYDSKVETAFAKAVKDIQPDLVHSFALYISCTPIVEVMKRNASIPWLYSSWGSDLYYFQNIPDYLMDIKAVLPRVTHLITDCLRDETIARFHGFKGAHVGVFPGGGGFDLDTMNEWITPLENRTVILVKGYQGRSGRALKVLEALEMLKKELETYQILVFGAAPEVIEYCANSDLNVVVHGMLQHKEVLQLLGKAYVYIGNSNSDGLPNTLLEAICMGAFPIQSNPGEATAEVITDGVNGLLIQDCEDTIVIQKRIKDALSKPNMIKKAHEYNFKLRQNYGYEVIKNQVLEVYNAISL